jgi:hypothetical protein
MLEADLFSLFHQVDATPVSVSPMQDDKLYIKPFSLKPRFLFKAESLRKVLCRTVRIQNPESEVKKVSFVNFFKVFIFNYL